MLPSSAFWNDWTNTPLADRLVDAIARVQMLALAYRSDETWNESAFTSKKADESFSQATPIPDVEKRGEVMKDIKKFPAARPRYQHREPWEVLGSSR